MSRERLKIITTGIQVQGILIGLVQFHSRTEILIVTALKSIEKEINAAKPVSSAIMLAFCELEKETVGLNQNPIDDSVSVVVSSTRVSAFLLRTLYPGREIQVGFVLGKMRWFAGSGIMPSPV